MNAHGAALAGCTFLVGVLAGWIWGRRSLLKASRALQAAFDDLKATVDQL
jgi:hypothetical protein